MKTKKILFLAVLGLVLCLNIPIAKAQLKPKSNILYFDSREHILRGIEFYENKRYEKAISVFSQIPKSDSLYATALYEMALTYYTMENIDSAIFLGELGLTLSKSTDSFIGLLGNAYDDSGKSDKAIDIYKKGLKQYPYNQLMHYNLGVTYYRIDSLDLAEEQFIISAKLNPYHFRTQLYLGMLNEQKGRMVEALLCYYLAAIINPKSGAAAEQLEKYLNGESTLVNKSTKYPIAEEDRVPEFEQLENIVSSKIALNPKFKTKTKINDIIVKQGEMFFNKMVYNPNVDNFYMNYHTRLFVQIRDKKMFEPLFFHIFSGYDGEKIQNWLKKKKKKHDAFIDFAVKSIDDARKTGLINLKKAKDTIFYNFDDKGYLVNFGHYSDKNKKIKEGKWTWVHSSGGLETEIFHVNDKEDGEIILYNEEGVKTFYAVKKNGEFNGPYINYCDNGEKELEANMKNGEIESEYKKYYPSGQLLEVGTITKGKRNGETKVYNVGGDLEVVLGYLNGDYHGDYMKYYPDGKLKEKYVNVKGKANGEYLSYYPDGSLKKSGFYEKDKESGVWKEYYPNKVLKSEYTINSKLNGLESIKDFYSDGSIKLEGKAEGGKLITRFYARNGKLYLKTVTDNLIMVSFEYYDSEGKVIDKGEQDGKVLKYRRRDENGRLLSEGKIVNGKYEGDWNYYNGYGLRIETKFFKNDEIEGADSLFYENGALKTVMNFKKGLLDGYYEGYSISGNIMAEGWCKKGSQQGLWKYYYVDGSLKSKNYYADGEYQGWQEYYSPDGKINEEIFYEYGYFSSKIRFDSTGKITAKTNLKNGNGMYEIKAPNGVSLIRIQNYGGKNHGDLEAHFMNGNIKRKVKFLNDLEYDKSFYYDELGNLLTTRNYLNGERWGKTETFENGKLTYEANYLDDMIFGTAKYVFPNGKSEIEYSYQEDELNGKTNYFSNDGQLSLVIDFVNDYPVSYTYKDKTGKFVTPIPINKDTVHIVVNFPNGKKFTDYSYVYGVRTGKYEQYFTNGNLYLKYERVGRELHGNRLEYFENGKVKKNIAYYYGEQHGESKEYFENGQLKIEEFYVCGLQHGVSRTYDSKGKLIIERFYYYDEMLSETKY